ncbi:MAG: hypothetical protein ACTHJ7_01235 [Candidatus Nitrosocosmicus sp.]
MISKRINIPTKANYNILSISISKSNNNLISILGLFLISSFIFFGPIQNLNQANAQNSLGQAIQQFNNNLQSNINKQIQSNLNQGIQSNSNNNNCNGNNLSIQSQTSTNGQTTSTSKSSCNGQTSFSSSSNNANLKGIISSSEYDIQSGAIINTLYGNWSLTTNTNGFTDFKALFTKQPIFYELNNNAQTSANTFASNNNPGSTTTADLNSTSSSANSNVQQGLIAPQQQQQNSNSTTYNLSNFKVNSLQQQNQDTTYVGTIDVVQTIHSNDPNQPDVTNSFNGIGVSITILNGKTLAINFDNQTPLFNEFKDIPLVGVIQ